ncbi:hypothetical protein NKH94_29275 [Mesorhizobium australicum]|uniref:tetratricopeptide repeat protein n=1 Tax=Mesorhizobium australicum TaxID=536018 RepID=UPI00333A3479
MSITGYFDRRQSDENFSPTVLRNLTNIEQFAKILVYSISASIVGFSLSVGLTAGDLAGGFVIGLRALCVAGIVAIASGCVGGLLGFLFGIPKLLQRQGSPAPASTSHENSTESNESLESKSRRFFMTNTSLEEISDWLTKIIIGIGLVQFQQVMSYMWRSSVYAASYIYQLKVIDSENGSYAIDGSVPSAFLFAIVIATLLIACLFVYLETRTRLALLFLDMEAVSDAGGDKLLEDALARPVSTPVETVNTVAGSVAPGPSAGAAVPLAVTAPLTNADRDVTSIPREQLRTAIDIAGWASAQARAKNYQASEDAFRDALQRDPNNVDVMLRLAEVRQLRGNTAGCLDTILEAIKKAPEREDVVTAGLRAQLDALYLPAPEGFEKSLAIADALEKTAAKGDPLFRLRKAAAYGQKYSYQSTSGSAADLQKIENAALAEVTALVKMEPSPESQPRIWLRDLLEGSNSYSDDLVIFKDNKRFQDIVYKK